VETGLALPDLTPCRQESVSKTVNLLFGLAQQMEGQSLRSPWTNAWKTFELVDQPC
jgi:hypothetical protein